MTALLSTIIRVDLFIIYGKIINSHDLDCYIDLSTKFYLFAIWIDLKKIYSTQTIVIVIGSWAHCEREIANICRNRIIKKNKYNIWVNTKQKKILHNYVKLFIDTWNIFLASFNRVVKVTVDRRITVVLRWCDFIRIKYILWTLIPYKIGSINSPVSSNCALFFFCRQPGYLLHYCSRNEWSICINLICGVVFGVGYWTCRHFIIDTLTRTHEYCELRPNQVKLLEQLL